MYNNETEQFELDDDVMQSQWLVDSRGYLYIITAEIEGPDVIVEDAPAYIEKLKSLAIFSNEDIYYFKNTYLLCVIDILSKIKDQEIPKELCDILELQEIPDVLKRFSEEDGYYYA